MWFFYIYLYNKKKSHFVCKMIRNKYKDVIVFLKKTNFINKRGLNTLAYKKNNIIISLYEKEIIIFDLIENRTYKFSEETTNQLIIDFLLFLDNQYHHTI